MSSVDCYTSVGLLKVCDGLVVEGPFRQWNITVLAITFFAVLFGLLLVAAGVICVFCVDNYGCFDGFRRRFVGPTKHDRIIHVATIEDQRETIRSKLLAEQYPDHPELRFARSALDPISERGFLEVFRQLEQDMPQHDQAEFDFAFTKQFQKLESIAFKIRRKNNQKKDEKEKGRNNKGKSEEENQRTLGEREKLLHNQESEDGAQALPPDPEDNERWYRRTVRPDGLQTRVHTFFCPEREEYYSKIEESKAEQQEELSEVVVHGGRRRMNNLGDSFEYPTGPVLPVAVGAVSAPIIKQEPREEIKTTYETVGCHSESLIKAEMNTTELLIKIPQEQTTEHEDRIDISEEDQTPDRLEMNMICFASEADDEEVGQPKRESTTNDHGSPQVKVFEILGEDISFKISNKEEIEVKPGDGEKSLEEEIVLKPTEEDDIEITSTTELEKQVKIKGDTEESNEGSDQTGLESTMSELSRLSLYGDSSSPPNSSFLDKSAEEQ